MKLFMSNKLGVRRALVLVLLTLVSFSLRLDSANGLHIPDTDFVQGVLGFLRSLETSMEKKTAWFYRHFGKNVDPSMINRVTLCDYGDTSKVKFCSPTNKRQAPVQNPNLPKGVTTKNNALSLANKESFVSIPSRCLEDPDAPECHNLRTLGDNNASLRGTGFNAATYYGIDELNGGGDIIATNEVPSEAPGTEGTPHSFLTPMSSAPIGATATSFPTRHMCYGNHGTLKKSSTGGDEMTNVRGTWCEFEMPSVSLEPSGAPIVFPGSSNERQEVDGSSFPTPKPSAIVEAKASIGSGVLIPDPLSTPRRVLIPPSGQSLTAPSTIPLTTRELIPSTSFPPSGIISTVKPSTPCVCECNSLPPSDCVDEVYSVTEDDIINKYGSDNEPILEDAIKIIRGGMSNITIEISQLWSKEESIHFFVHYGTATHESTCEAIEDFSYNQTVVKDLQCYDGWTDVGIFIYFDFELTLEECQECKPPESDEEDVIAYYFELPCAPSNCDSFEPSKAPSQAPSSLITTVESLPPSDCVDAVYPITENNIVNKSGSDVPIPNDAMKIIRGDMSNITIEISQLWSNDEGLNFFINYNSTTTNDTVCQPIQDFSYNQTVVKNLQCYDGWTDVGIFVYLDSELTEEDCQQCNPLESDGEGAIAYYLKLPCSVDVRCDGSRRLKVFDAMNIERGFMTEEMKAAAEPIDELEDAPYCIHDDFPCEGDEDNMVHVCHYSSRSGYQTFCIPEMDSDILRFDSNHHCGPCDGWNGVERSGPDWKDNLITDPKEMVTRHDSLAYQIR